MNSRLHYAQAARKFADTLFSYFAIFCGVVLVVVCLTGALLLFQQEIDRLTHRSLFYNSASHNVSAPRIPLDDLAIRTSARWQQPIGGFHLSDDPRRTTEVITANGRHAFYDSYTGALVGDRAGLTPLDRIRQIHTSLLFGRAGTRIVGIATVFLILWTLVRLYQWAPVKRISGKWKVSTHHIDLRMIGRLVLAKYTLFFCATGLLITHGDTIKPYLYIWTHSSPAPTNTPSLFLPNAQPLSIEKAIEIARNAMPSASPLSVRTPSNARDVYHIALHYPGDSTPEGESWIDVDQYSGSILEVEDSRTMPLGTRLLAKAHAVHTGNIFGIWSRIIAATACAALLVEIAIGIVQWWTRKERRENVNGSADSSAIYGE